MITEQYTEARNSETSSFKFKGHRIQKSPTMIHGGHNNMDMLLNNLAKGNKLGGDKENSDSGSARIIR